MNLYFPGIASLSKKLADFWEKKTKGETIPDFGLFYLMALNLDVGEPVLSIQHRDNKNFALGVCLLFIFGASSHLELSIISTRISFDFKGFSMTESSAGWCVGRLELLSSCLGGSCSHSHQHFARI